MLFKMAIYIYLTHSYIYKEYQILKMFIRIFRLLSRFSLEGKKLSKPGMKAVMAEHIFKSLADPSIKDVDEPLMEHVLKLTASPAIQKHWRNTNDQIQDARSQLLDSITVGKGVDIPKLLTKAQQRFVSASNVNNKITFYPNHFATPTIFNSLHRAYQGYKIMTVGKQGISKSMNYLYAWYLSSIAARYQYMHPQEAVKLRQQQLLSRETIKIIYISFREQKSDYQTAYQMLLNQCPELQKQIQDQIQNLSIRNYKDKMIKTLQLIKIKYKEKQIQCLVVFDQINSLARIYKQYNDIQLRDPNNISLALQNTIQFLTNLYKAASSYPYIIYNSSNNIQRQLMGVPTNSRMKTLGLNYHSHVQIITCSYQSKIITNSVSLKEIYRILGYQIIKKLSPQQIKEYQRDNKMAKLCDQLAQKYGFMSAITPYTLRIGVQTSLEITQSIKTEDLKAKMETLINNMKTSGCLLLRQKCSTFFKDINQEIMQKKMILGLQCSLLYYQSLKAEASLKNIKNQSQKTIKVTPEKINFSDLYAKGVPLEHITQYLNKDIFQVKMNEQCIKLIISRQQFESLNWRQIYIEDKNFSNFLSFISQDLLKTQTGPFIERAIISYIRLNHKYCHIIDGKNTFIVQNLSNFLHVNCKQNYQNNFKQICQAEARNSHKKQSSDSYTFGIPITQKGEYSCNSKCFDFMLVRYLAEKKSYDFVTYDVTASKTKDYIENKFNVAESCIIQIMEQISFQSKKKQKSEFKLKINSWEHRVICYQINLDKKIKTINKKMKHRFSKVTLTKVNMHKLNLFSQQINKSKSQIIRQNLQSLIDASSSLKQEIFW